MKNNLLATVLLVALTLTGVWGAFLVLQYNRYNARVIALQNRVNEINNTRSLLQSLANDSLAYSQIQPALRPVLQQFGLVPASPAPAPAATTAPVAAPTKSAPAKTAPKTSTSKK
jgi:hypothetical protein